jgi:glutathione synthase/RimK-type ligase-like ATP-grasp enzyme
MRSRYSIALATYDGCPRLCDDDRVLLTYLEDAGFACVPAVWDCATVDWKQFDAVILRSCWDYHLKTAATAAFVEWLRSLVRAGTRVFNEPATVFENIDKRYLQRLARSGVLIPESRWIDAGSTTPLDMIINDMGCDDVVVKPTVSASAFRTWRSCAASAGSDETRYRSLVSEREVMVQQFAPGIIAAGEWSLIFFAGKFSHSILKRPAPGDFRVQVDFGGSREAVVAPRMLVDEAARIVSIGAPGALYARVDGIFSRGRFVLMELELIDPMLFFGYCREAPAAFADALGNALRATSDG